MTEENEGLSSKQTRALELTLKGLSDAEVARRVKVTRQTVNEWRNQNYAFMEALDARRRMMREGHMDRLNELIEEAVETVQSALHSPNENTRLRAATLVLRVSGLQGYLKQEKKADSGRAEFIKELSEAIGEVAKDLGFSDPTKPDEPKQLGEGTGPSP